MRTIIRKKLQLFKIVANLIDRHANSIKKIQNKTVNGKTIGRKPLENTVYYVKKIAYVLSTGISWYDFSLFDDDRIGEPAADTIRKKHNYFINEGIYKKVNEELMNTYLTNFKGTITDLFIDSTCIPNINGVKEMTGYSRKIKGKKSMNNTIISDNNNIIMAHIYDKSNIHDSKMIEATIKKLPNKFTENATYNKPYCLTGDKGYIIDKKRNIEIRKNFHIHVNAQTRKNMKRKKTDKNIESSKIRYKIENVNATIKRTYKRNAAIRDRSQKSLNAWMSLTSTMILSNFLLSKIGEINSDSNNIREILQGDI